jgi:transposase InsO family protein
MSRQNYYTQRRRRQRERVEKELVLQLVQAERAVQPRLGTRKLQVRLKKAMAQAGMELGRDRLFELLRQSELLIKPLPAEYPRTTNSYHCLPVFTNRIKGLDVSKPNQVWVSDLTYIRTREGFLYLSLVTDKMSRKIVGYHCGDTLEAEGCIQALDRALDELPKESYPIHHSDRGTQYCSHAYVNRLHDRGLGISMTEHNHCAENALAERVNGILKIEYALSMEFLTKKDALLAVEQAVQLYNTCRPHMALNYHMPFDIHALAA